MIYFIDEKQVQQIKHHGDKVEIIFLDRNYNERTGYAVKNADGTFDLTRVEVG